jgi:trigger factor
LLNELGESNNLKVNDQEFRNEVQKQVQSMPGQEKQIFEYYQKNPSAANNLKGSLYEGKIINLIKQKSTKTKKIVSLKEAEAIIKLEHDKRHAQIHKHSKNSPNEVSNKKPKKVVKSSIVKKKIRKK